jgi:putative two-component system response regulator
MNQTLEYDEPASVLVVDDSPDNLSLMNGLLKDEYRVKVANNGGRALKIAQSHRPPDLILLDVMMPCMDGYEVCRQLKGDPRTRNIPIIFLTARCEAADEQLGLELGAVDYITKPISPPIVMARVRNHLRLKSMSDFLRDKNEFLMQEVTRRTCEVMTIQEVTILALASLAETRDLTTGYHLRRTQLYVKALARELQSHPRFREFLTEDNINMLYKSAPLHDIGKVGIPDRILLKPGPLDPDEVAIMRTHTVLGRDAIEHAEKSVGVDLEFLRIAKEIVLFHQEKWDGTGYPEKLSGDDIPISARLMAVADVYDALTNRRAYKEALSHEHAVAIIMAGKGTHFDPDLVEAFSAINEEFRRIALKFSDLYDGMQVPDGSQATCSAAPAAPDRDRKG